MAELQHESQWDTDRVLTIPNVLSFIRLLGVPVFGWLIIANQDLAAVVLLGVFGITDWFDGFLARRLKQRTELGAKLDPIADRLYILMALIALCIRGILPWPVLVVLAARDVMLICLVPFLRRQGTTALPVNQVGKAATMCLLVAFPLLLLAASDWVIAPYCAWLGWPILVLGAVLYWIAGALYVKDTVQLTRAAKT